MHGVHRDRFSYGNDLVSAKQGRNEVRLGREWREGGGCGGGVFGAKTTTMYSSSHLFFDCSNDD